MKINNVILIVIVLSLMGCETLHSNRKPFSSFANKKVTLKQTSRVEEWAYNGGLRETLYKNEQATEFVIDDGRLFAKPLKRIDKPWGGKHKLFSIEGYPRKYVLISQPKNDWYTRNSKNSSYSTGPYRIYELPIGTELEITRVFSSNYVEGVNHELEGYVVLPQTGERVPFEYGLGHGNYIHRAPWEDESLPSKTYVGYEGRYYDPSKNVYEFE